MLLSQPYCLQSIELTAVSNPKDYLGKNAYFDNWRR